MDSSEALIDCDVCEHKTPLAKAIRRVPLGYGEFRISVVCEFCTCERVVYYECERLVFLRQQIDFLRHAVRLETNAQQRNRLAHDIGMLRLEYNERFQQVQAKHGLRKR